MDVCIYMCVCVCLCVDTWFGGAGGVVAAGFGGGGGGLYGGGRGPGRLGVHDHLGLQLWKAPAAVDVLKLLDLRTGERNPTQPKHWT